MAAPKNEIKARLQRGERQIGCWLNLADPIAAEVAAQAGFDWLLIDAEHGPNDLRFILAQLQALGSHPAVVRLPSGDPVAIKRVLDIGAQTLLIPMVESGEEAANLVAATRYPPAGRRGVASAIVRASRYGSDPEYFATADAEIALILQVENRAGLSALDEIASTEGVDAVFIGPADLAADMGFPGPGEPAAQEVVMDAIRRIRSHGTAAGILGFDAPYIAAAESAGATFLGVGSDVALFAAALRDQAARFR
ncbi:MAG: HpcH/HpaI aldolase/citrate lyase family protein [Pseudomonadota bacterium]